MGAKLILGALVCVGAWGTCYEDLEQLAYLTQSQARSSSDNEVLRRFRNDPVFAHWLRDIPARTHSSEELLNLFDRLPQSTRNRLAEEAERALPNVTVNLGGYGRFLQSSHAIFSRFQFRLNSGPDRVNNPPMRVAYRKAVLSLRRGDTVQFGDRRFVLGEYLGAGNASHIFAIQGQADRILRIPFSVFSNERAGQTPQVLLQAFLSGAPGGRVNQVRVIESGPGYAVTSRVYGEENGERFLERVGIDLLTEAEFDSALVRLGPQESNRLRRLRTQLELLREARIARNPRLATQGRALELWTMAARQFVWDTQMNDWVLVDFN